MTGHEIGRTWVLDVPMRPVSLNAERRMVPHERARFVDEWRSFVAWLAKSRRIPRLDRVQVTARQILANGRGIQDVGNCLPSVKASVDGLVDAGVLADDSPGHLVVLTFVAPVVTGADGLRLEIVELLDGDRAVA